MMKKNALLMLGKDGADKAIHDDQTNECTAPKNLKSLGKRNLAQMDISRKPSRKQDCSSNSQQSEVPQNLEQPSEMAVGDDENHRGGTTKPPQKITIPRPPDPIPNPKEDKEPKKLTRKVRTKPAASCNIITPEKCIKRSYRKTLNSQTQTWTNKPDKVEGEPKKQKLHNEPTESSASLSQKNGTAKNQLENYFIYQAAQGQKQVQGNSCQVAVVKDVNADRGRRRRNSYRINTSKKAGINGAPTSKKPCPIPKIGKQNKPMKKNTQVSEAAVEHLKSGRPQFTDKTTQAITNLKRTDKTARDLKLKRLTTKHRMKPRHTLTPEKLAEIRVRDKLLKRKLRLSASYKEAEKKSRQKRSATYKTKMEKLISKFHEKTKNGPTYICISCKRLLYRHNVRIAEKFIKLNTTMSKKCLRGKETFNGNRWVCETCKNHIMNRKVPPMSRANGCKFPMKPSWMKLNKLEWRLLAPRLVFMKVHQAPRGRQYKIEGNVVNVVADVSNTVTCLPRLPSQKLAIPIKLKRRIRYHRHAYSQNVRPNIVWKAAKWLSKNAPLYKELNMNLTPQWHKIFKKISIFKRAHPYKQLKKDGMKVQTPATESSPKGKKKTKRRRTSKRRKIYTNSLIRYKAIKRKVLDTAKKVHKSNHSHNNTKFTVPGKTHRKLAIKSGPRGSPGTLDTMLTADGFLETSEKNKILSFAPGENKRPMSVFLDKDCEELAYPDIYLGNRRPELRSVPINYSDVVKAELMNKDRRAAMNVENLFFKTKKLQMKIITGQTSIALRKHKPNQKPITASTIKSSDSLQSILKTDQGYQFLKTVRGSPPYFEAAKKDVFAMIRQLGPATFFISLSAAETKWTHLLKNLGRIVDKKEYTDDEIKRMKWDTTTRLIQSDPITCARHFEYQLQTFIRDFIKSKQAPIGELLDYFYRIEMQHRGSCHVHMVVWIKGAPSPSQSSHKEITKFIDKYITCRMPKFVKDQELILRQRHHHTDTCKKNNTTCRFKYPQPPMVKTTIIEPLSKDDSDYNHHKENWEKIQKFLDTHNTNVYMSIKSMLEKFELSEFEYKLAVATSIRSNTIFLKRKLNEIHINNYNKHCIEAWQANMDIQYILDTYACATYVVQYITKGTRGLSQLLKAAAKEARGNETNIKEQMKLIGNRFLNSVEISAQEAAYLALQMPLKRSSRKCVFINTSPPEDRIQLLKPISRIKQMEDDETDLSTSNMTKRYAERPDNLEEICLADWVAFYDSSVPYQKDSYKLQTDGTPPEIEHLNYEKGIDDLPKSDTKNPFEDKRRKKARIIRCPWFNLKQDEEKHYRELIMLFVPWRNEESDINQDSATFKEQYNQHRDIITSRLDTYAPCRSAVEDAEAAIKEANANRELDPTNIAPLTVHMNAIDESNTQETNDPNFVQLYDIGEDMGVHLPNLPKYEDLKHNQIQDKDFRQAVQSLNKEQRNFFDYINNIVLTNGDQQLIFLSGGAGCGKSWLTRAIYQNLIRIYNYKAGDDYECLKVLVMAPTGKAAHLIQGVTIHSALHAPFNSQSDQYHPLSCSLLNTLRTSLGNVEFIIIDEISMVGTNMLNFVNERMKEIKGSDEPFGSCHVLCVGDLFQLRPVADSWVFENPASKKDSLTALAPNIWSKHFKMFELTEIMRQKESKVFAQMLNRLREGNQTDEDIAFIKSREISNDFRTTGYPHQDVTHLFNTNDLVEEFNLTARLSDPIHFLANDSISHVSSKDLGIQLLKVLQNKPTKETMGLPTKLSIAMNDRVEISTNLDIADGLTNGASGVVCMLPQPKDESHILPAIGTIWIMFDEPSIGKHTRGINDNLYDEEIDPKWTPIPTIKKQIKISRNSPITATRYQFPIRIAAGKTIHRSQGQTLVSAVTDFMYARGSHKHYVALSRVTNSDNLFVTNFDKNKIKTSAVVKTEMERLRKETLQISNEYTKNISKNTTTYMFHNVRTLHKHSQDLSHDLSVKKSDVLSIAETHLRQTTSMKHLTKTFPFVYHNHPIHTNIETSAKHGTSILAKYKLENVKHYNTSTLEASTAYDPKTKVHIACVYRYPSSSVPQFLEDLKNIPATRTDEHKVIMGDFNINIHSKNQQTIAKICSDMTTQQLVRTSTTKYNTIIDHMHTNISAVKCAGVLKTYYSDHDQIFIQF